VFCIATLVHYNVKRLEIEVIYTIKLHILRVTSIICYRVNTASIYDRGRGDVHRLVILFKSVHSWTCIMSVYCMYIVAHRRANC